MNEFIMERIIQARYLARQLKLNIERTLKDIMSKAFFCNFGPRFYPMGSIVIALVSSSIGPYVGPLVSPSLDIS